MEDLWERAEEILAAGKPFVVATIIRTRGSVPREVGAKMVVPPDCLLYTSPSPRDS